MRSQLPVLFCALGGAVLAQTTPPAAPPQSYKSLHYPPLPAPKIPDITTAMLPNGMKLYLLENHELPLVSGFALVRTGSVFEPAAKVGLAQVTGTVMRTGGTKAKAGDQLDVELENIAASVETGIGDTSGSVSFNCLRENTDQVLAAFRDVMTSPEFRQDKLDLAKNQLGGMIARRNDDPHGITGREFNKLIYGKDAPYGRRMEYATLNAITRDDLVQFYHRYFFPSNVMLAVQGDFSAPEMKAKLETLFAGWTSQQPPVPKYPEVVSKPAAGIYLATKTDVTQTFFELGHIGGLLSDKDYPALEVMGDILGGGFASRLFKKVRTELGYAYSINADWAAGYEHPGIFEIAGSTKSASTAETLKAIRVEVDRIRSGEVTDEELKTARDTVLNSFVFNFDRPSKTLNRLVTYEYYGYPKDFIFRYQKAVAAVTRADVLRVAKEYLKPEQFVIVATGNPKDFQPPLDTLGMTVSPIDLTIPQPKQDASKADAASLRRGRQLLLRMQQAMGGAEKLAAVKDYTQNAEADLQAGGGAIKSKQKNVWMAPSTFRQDQELPFGKIIAFFDGTAGWLSTPQGTQPLPDPVIKQVENTMFRSPMSVALSDRAPDRTVNAIGDSAFEVSDKQGHSVKVFLDEKTGLPERQLYQAPAMAGAPMEVEETLSDWRDVSGIRMPFKTTIKQGGQKGAEITIKDMFVNTGVKADEVSRKP